MGSPGHVSCQFNNDNNNTMVSITEATLSYQNGISHRKACMFIHKLKIYTFTGNKIQSIDPGRFSLFYFLVIDLLSVFDKCNS